MPVDGKHTYVASQCCVASRLSFYIRSTAVPMHRVTPYQYVTGFAKRGLSYTSSLPTLMIYWKTLLT